MGCSEKTFVSTWSLSMDDSYDNKKHFKSTYWLLSEYCWIIVILFVSAACMHAQLLSHVRLFATPWTTGQPPLSMGFPRKEYWSELPFPSPGKLPDPGIEPAFPALQADSLLLSHQGSPLETISGWNQWRFASLVWCIFSLTVDSLLQDSWFKW